MKNDLRNTYKKKRELMTKPEVEEKSLLASKHFLSSEIYKKSSKIMVYMPLGNEIDTRHIIKTAFDDGKTVILPVTDAESGDITPCIIRENTEFVKGAFSVAEPMEKETAEVSEIDAVLVPGIVFNKNGDRIGFGKGCYDRFLKNISAVKLGFCYDFQIYDNFSGEKQDISMDYLISEEEMIKIL